MSEKGPTITGTRPWHASFSMSTCATVRSALEVTGAGVQAPSVGDTAVRATQAPTLRAEDLIPAETSPTGRVLRTDKASTVPNPGTKAEDVRGGHVDTGAPAVTIPLATDERAVAPDTTTVLTQRTETIQTTVTARTEDQTHDQGASPAAPEPARRVAPTMSRAGKRPSLNSAAKLVGKSFNILGATVNAGLTGALLCGALYAGLGTLALLGAVPFAALYVAPVAGIIVAGVTLGRSLRAKPEMSLEDKIALGVSNGLAQQREKDQKRRNLETALT